MTADTTATFPESEQPSTSPRDRPRPTDPAIVSPLGPFKGEKPPAPAWFTKALAHEPDRRFIPVEGAQIETLTWGEVGKPGLLLMHGNGANADWYSFIAPFLAKEYRVTAMSWSGMGRSDWRTSYSLDQFGREAIAAAEATGLFDAPVKPVFVAHSFGGDVAMRLAMTRGERLAGTVVLDNVPRPPHLRWSGPPSTGRPVNVYPDLTAALARFRLMPPQGCENLFIVDHIARHSLKPHGDDGGQVWRFDPNIWVSLDRSVPFIPEEWLPGARCPLAFIWGERSQLVPDEALTYTQPFLTPGTPMTSIPDSDHHVMLDQPLATVTALRTLLAAWPRT